MGRHDMICTDCHRTEDHRIAGRSITVSVDNENQIACTDCHSPHGSAGPKALQRLTLNQQCFACHAEKRGPFLWEHEPVTEDCAACHVPHGSNNAALLRHRGPFLCQQCHQNVGRLAGHINQKREFGGAGNARFLFGANCMNCHSQVHGSNHPSGFALQR